MNKLLSILHSIFIKPFYYIMLLGLLLVRILFKSPIFLLFWGIAFAITTWIYGQVIALITTHKFLPLSYFDLSKYPNQVQEIFNANFELSSLLNWYILPLIILGVIEFILFFKVMFLSNSERGRE